MTPVLRQHWDQATAATATGRSRRTIQSWCLPMPWRPALLSPDSDMTAQCGRPMYRITDVIGAELASRSGRGKGRKTPAQA